MKAVLKLTRIFILVLLTACNSAEDDKFSLTGSIQNAGESTLIEMYEGETLVDTIPLDDQGQFYYEGNAPHAVLYTLVVGQRPFLLVVNNGEKVEFKADLKDPGNYMVEGSATSAKMKELDSITENFRQQHNNLQKEFERRMSNGEESSAIQHELTTKNQGYIRELSARVLPFSMENKDNLAGFYGMLTLYSIDPTGHEEEMIRYMEDIKDNFQENEEVRHFAARMEEKICADPHWRSFWKTAYDRMK